MSESIVDAHVHFWDTSLLEYPWLEALPPLQRAFHPSDYDTAMADVPVEGIFFVEANPRPDLTLEEVGFVETLVESEGRIEGIIAFVDLLDVPARSRTLEALVERPLVRGIRHNIQGNPAGFALQPDFVAGAREAGKRGFTFDICVTHDQLEEVLAFARQVEDTRLVLDHCGKPAIRNGEWEPWATNIRRLAALPYLHCKISGMLTEADHHGWTRDEVLTYAQHVVECFGTDRVIYGSDWPVMTLAERSSDWYSLTRDLTASWSEDERRGFYRENSRRFYRG